MLTISEVSTLIGVTRATLRRWDKKDYLVPKRTLGGHRRYSLEQLADFLPEEIEIPPKKTRTVPKSTYIYARVSSAKQKKDGNLDRQVERLKEFCRENFEDGLPIKVVKEYGSGLNSHEYLSGGAAGHGFDGFDRFIFGQTLSVEGAASKGVQSGGEGDAKN